MAKSCISSRELNQDLASAKRAAKDGPVIITDRGEPAFVLTTFEEHERARKKKSVSLLDALSMREDKFELHYARGAFYERFVVLD